ncbi:MULTISPECIES: ATP-dependent nuclease [Serratia]|nr:MULTISPECIES: AAA family ATPase [Serratia]MBH3047031.1 AAA family ATPase [Serratia marcescens]MBI6176248.1 AAA family ATPase [Serratia marcescens]MDY0766576.1 AAA family ATPase [Serratia nevei]NDY34903.1 AAA family ATPase [Serratia marcescens]NDY39349.1 AAA family ATPase [Serratia marcescens]
MKLRISKISLKNFKTFKNITINPNSDFNIIIGENSAGKSTVFEAIHLWEKCYKTYILASRKGFYKVKKSTNRYVNYQELDFLRITSDEDLFHDPKDPNLGKCSEITLTLKNEEKEDNSWELGFKVTCPTSIENAFFRVQPIDESQFTGFAESFCDEGNFLDEAIFIYQTRPVAGVHQFEPYYNEAQIKRKIQKGYSHEVLRNKIIAKRKSISDLESSISEILEKDVKFAMPSDTRKNKDEFIQLDVSIDSSKYYDLHLQGSGFLQIVEILSTVEFIEAPLKLLLVDEPDSHIHTKLQHNLLAHLKKIDHNQFFIISHNDQFVSNSGEGEVFFLNEDAKLSGHLEAIDPNGFDIIKNSLGGVILSLERLNNAKLIAFVEGKDDEKYLRNLNIKIKEITNPIGCLKNVVFFPLRGKDNILQKVEYNKRTLNSILSGKSWHVIFDRDFSTNTIDINLRKKINDKHCTPYSHIGYCIESVLFSDLNILKKYVLSLTKDIEEDALSIHIDTVINELKDSINDINSQLNKEVEIRFNSQKNNRPEFSELNFVDVIRSWCEDEVFKPELVMSKPIIKMFVTELENKIGVSLFLRSSNEDDEVASTLLLKYFDFIKVIDDLYPSFRNLMEQLEVLERV